MSQRGQLPATQRAAAAPSPITISQAAARRFLLYHQGLLKTGEAKDASRAGQDTASAEAAAQAKAQALAAIRWLECVQIDPVNTVAPNHHLVLANRVPGYRPEHLEALIDRGLLFEHFLQARCAIPIEDFANFRPRLEVLDVELQGHWAKVRDVAQQILEHVRRHGPVTARTFTDSGKVVGYWDREPKTKTSSLALEVLWETGQLMITRREGNLRYYDLPERVVPKDLLDRFASTPIDDAWRALRHKYYRAYRLFDPGDFRFGWRRQTAAERRATLETDLTAGLIVPVTVEGVKRAYYALAEDAHFLRQAESWEGGGSAFLSPLDNLLWRRERVQDLFGFAYTWEQYVPAAKRQFGAYTMPILADGDLVGRLDPRLDRATSVLVISHLALEPGVRPSRALAGHINRAMARLLASLGARGARYDRVSPASLVRHLDQW